MSEISDKVIAFGYPHLLDENVQLLTQRIREKDHALPPIMKVLVNVKTSLANMDNDLHSSCKRIRELEASINEVREGWKKAQNDSLEMCSENIDISKEYAM